jgi:CheY-specific phosphatase CheX
MDNHMGMALYQAAILTFEDLSFLLPTPELDRDQQNAAADAAVAVAFGGPFAGSLVVQVCGGLLPALAANMLGEEEPPALALQQDALREIANVICGNLLPQVAGKQAIFHLGAPQLIEVADSPVKGAASLPSAEAHIGLEQGRADLWLLISSDPPGKEPIS